MTALLYHDTGQILCANNVGFYFYSPSEFSACFYAVFLYALYTVPASAQSTVKRNLKPHLFSAS